MPAPRINHIPMVLAATLVLAGCASSPPEAPVGAAEPAPARADVTHDEYRPPPPPAPTDALEATLEAYEQQLARNESRLHAMGVRIAAVETRTMDAAAAAEPGFAAPPPARPGDASRGQPRAKSASTMKKSAANSPPTATPRPVTPVGGAQGVGRAAERAKDEDDDATHCGELCDLAHATCDLEAKICDLAARHTEDPRYAEVCRRADDDCRAASAACNLCAP